MNKKKNVFTKKNQEKQFDLVEKKQKELKKDKN